MDRMERDQYATERCTHTPTRVKVTNHKHVAGIYFSNFINRIYKKYNYLIDTHTAVAFDVLEQYRTETGDQTPALVVSTASPFKFCDSVLQALGEKDIAPGLQVLDQLTEVTGRQAPAPLAELKNKRVRFDRSVAKENMVDMVLDMLN